eukprot:INCI3613.4.p1 GENE.INCI3613.4~~INCI3613.4.p1  ORF type:complete len:663 (-),score=110.76 INCI3613.4:1389-3377(-)
MSSSSTAPAVSSSHPALDSDFEYDSEDGDEQEQRQDGEEPRSSRKKDPKRRPSTFGTATRAAVFKLNNELGSSRWDSDTANVPFFDTSHNWGKQVKGGSFDRAKREEILQHNDGLGATVPYSQTADVSYVSRDGLNAAYGASRSAVMGTSSRGDLLLQYNVMNAAFPRTDSANAKFVDNPLSPIDSRYKSPRSVDIGRGSTREDHAKLVNSLGVAMPKDLSATSPTELLEHPKSDARFRRVRGAEDWSKQKTSRDDIHKQANVLASSTYSSQNPDADWPQDVDKVFKTGLGGAIPKAKPAELLKHYNSLKVLVPHTGTADVDYVDKPISKHDSRFKTVPSFTWGASKREDVFKQYNTLHASIPIGRTDTVKFVDKAISNFDSRFRSSTSPRFGADKTQRDDVLKLNNVLGVAVPSSLTANASFAPTSAMQHLSSSRRVPSATMGSSTREAIYKMSNPLGAALPVDRTPHANFCATKSKIDSRFRSAPSATFGVSNREDAMKLNNSLKVALPSREASKTPYLHPDDFSDSITRNHARRGMGKWADHEMGIASRTQHWKEANVMKVQTPFAAHTANVDFPGVSFSTTQREDALLQRGALSGAHPPHSRRAAREKLYQKQIKQQIAGGHKKPGVPRTRVIPSKTHFKVRSAATLVIGGHIGAACE